MSATIIPFRAAFRGRQPTMAPAAVPLPTPFTREWQQEHLPLIDAAMDLLQADDAEFERRCQLMADAEGRTLLEELTTQLDRLGGHVGDVFDALGTVATRIRNSLALQTSGQPA